MYSSDLQRLWVTTLSITGLHIQLACQLLTATSLLPKVGCQYLKQHSAEEELRAVVDGMLEVCHATCEHDC